MIKKISELFSKKEVHQMSASKLNQNIEATAENANTSEQKKKYKSSVSRIYSDVFSGQPDSFFDHSDHMLFYGDSNEYDLERYLSFGTFSDVFEAVSIKSKEKCIVKVLKPVSLSRIKREVRILEYLRGGPNIITFIEIVRNPRTNDFSLIFEYVDNLEATVLYRTLRDLEIRFYLMELLKALDYMHSKGVIHRDLKPNNVVIDHKTHKLRLIDFGLAEFYYPKRKYGLQVATLQYKAPELMVGYKMYDYSVDMWAFGCVVATMIYLKFPFFNSKDHIEQMAAIVRVLGTEDLFAYLKKYNIQLNSHYDSIVEPCEKVGWDTLIKFENYHLASVFAFNLLDKLLRYDPAERLSAREAMKEPYFLPILEGVSPWQ